MGRRDYSTGNRVTQTHSSATVDARGNLRFQHQTRQARSPEKSQAQAESSAPTTPSHPRSFNEPDGYPVGFDMDSLEFDYGPADQPQYTLPHRKTKVTAQTCLDVKALNHAYRHKQSTWRSSSKTICFRGSKLFSSRKVPRVSGSAQAQVAHRWVRCGDVLTASDGRLSVANVAVGRTSSSHSTVSRHGTRHTTLPIGCGQLAFASTLATTGSRVPTPLPQPATNFWERRTRSGRTCVGTGSHITQPHQETPKRSMEVPW